MADEANDKSDKALRVFLTEAKAARPAIAKVLLSIQRGLFAGLEKDGLVAMRSRGDAPRTLRVAGAGRVVTLEGVAHRQGAQVVPCIAFRVGDRPLPVKLLLPPGGGSWVWGESAGLGVDGQQITTETTSKVFLKLLAGEVS